MRINGDGERERNTYVISIIIIIIIIIISNSVRVFCWRLRIQRRYVVNVIVPLNSSMRDL